VQRSASLPAPRPAVSASLRPPTMSIWTPAVSAPPSAAPAAATSSRWQSTRHRPPQHHRHARHHHAVDQRRRQRGRRRERELHGVAHQPAQSAVTVNLSYSGTAANGADFTAWSASPSGRRLQRQLQPGHDRRRVCRRRGELDRRHRQCDRWQLREPCHQRTNSSVSTSLVDNDAPRSASVPRRLSARQAVRLSTPRVQARHR